MECNRDEATRAKEIAEKKFAAKDISGAKKFALKAHNLYPGLEGLPQMMAAFDVYLSAENRIAGEPDWYGILDVNPVADEETIKKQYRKLALMLHPDKNKSIGADGAFKMISEAWGVISDKNKRTDYDQRRCPKTSQQKVPPTGGTPSAPPASNGFHNFSNNTTPKAGAQKKTARPGISTAASRQSKSNTFWTACNRCKMQYEYLRVYLNHNLLCPNCHEPFHALETAVPPPNCSKSNAPWSSTHQHPKSNHHTSNQNPGFTGHNSVDQTNFQWGPFSKTTGAGSATASPSTAAQAATVVQQAYEKVRREREEAQAAAKKLETVRKKNQGSKRAANNLSPGSDLKGERPAKKRNVNEEGRPNNSVNITNGGTSMPNASGSKHGGHDRDRANVSFVSNKPNSTRELTQIEIRNILEEKARREIQKKLNEWRSIAASKTTEKEKGKEKDGEKQKVVMKTDSSDPHKLVDSVDMEKMALDKKESLDTYVNLIPEAREPMSIMVPDPDFHDFDRDRSERSFKENQVWAAYDDDDGMPRYYALIHSVISFSPFKVKISWLNSKNNSELGPLNWVGSGFAKTCGDFRVGKHEQNNRLNSFSHKVKWTKGTRGAVRIFPKKADVWALYRNWSPDWNELTPDEVIHKYDMVEVVEDYNEEQGVFVTPLVKVAGFKTVFHRHLDPREVKKVPREEMFRFSHQVPSYLLTGSEARNAPKGCRELDPAATPLELLQVITEVKEEEMAEAAGEEGTASEVDVVIADTPEKMKVYTKGRKKELGLASENAEEVAIVDAPPEEKLKVYTKVKKTVENAERCSEDTKKLMT